MPIEVTVKALPAVDTTPADQRGGRRVVLSGNGQAVLLAPASAALRILAGADGWDMPDVDLSLVETPGEDGARVESVRIPPREMFLPLRIAGRDRVEHLQLRQLLAHILNPTAGPVTIVVEEALAPEVPAAMIVGYYAGGARGGHGSGWNTSHTSLWGVTLRCPDPWWYDVEPVDIPPLRPPQTIPWFPILPLRLGPGVALGTGIHVLNDGDGTAGPTWRIGGPATSWVLTNETTGETLGWSGTLVAGAWMDVVTWPDPSVRDSDGASRYHELDQTGPPAFWHLVPGVNVLTLQVGGGNADAGTFVQGSFRRRRLIQA